MVQHKYQLYLENKQSASEDDEDQIEQDFKLNFHELFMDDKTL